MTSRLLCRDYWITIWAFRPQNPDIQYTEVLFFDNFADKIPKKLAIHI